MLSKMEIGGKLWVYIESVIAYWSRVPKPAVYNYSPTEQEALALKV